MKNKYEDVIYKTIINEECYYSIIQAFWAYKGKLNKKMSYNSFYKYFVVWRVENEIESLSLNVSKIYSESDFERYINYLNRNEEVEDYGLQ